METVYGCPGRGRPVSHLRQQNSRIRLSRVLGEMPSGIADTLRCTLMPLLGTVRSPILSNARRIFCRKEKAFDA